MIKKKTFITRHLNRKKYTKCISLKYFYINKELKIVLICGHGK